MPKELLEDILERLTLKEAAKTSTLSKRWRCLWTSRPTLDLDIQHISLNKVSTFERNVSSILGQYNGPKLRELRIAGGVPWTCITSINDWMCVAISKGVCKLELDLSFSRVNDGNLYPVPTRCFAAKRIHSLTHLCLQSVMLSTQVFDLIITNCCYLESFISMHSNGLRHAKNTTLHQSLKSIRFSLCKGLESIQLWAPNLSSFDYHGNRPRISIKDCKQMLTLKLSCGVGTNSHPSVVCPKLFVSQFTSYFPKLEYLLLDVHPFQSTDFFAELGLLSNLKHLVLDAINNSLLPLVHKVAASMLRAAPNLQLLEINLSAIGDVHLNWRREALELPSMSSHPNLVELNFAGFRGDSYTMDFVAYILEHTTSLRKIDITPRRRSGRRDHSYKLNWREDEFEVCKEFMQQLRQRLPENVSLLFHDVQ